VIPTKTPNCPAAELLSDLSRVLQNLPRDFEQQSLLRIHAIRLSRGDPEESGVE
jgi:hypothetical protein